MPHISSLSITQGLVMAFSTSTTWVSCRLVRHMARLVTLRRDRRLYLLRLLRTKAKGCSPFCRALGNNLYTGEDGRGDWPYSGWSCASCNAISTAGFVIYWMLRLRSSGKCKCRFTSFCKVLIRAMSEVAVHRTVTTSQELYEVNI